MREYILWTAIPVFIAVTASQVGCQLYARHQARKIKAAIQRCLSILADLQASRNNPVKPA